VRLASLFGATVVLLAAAGLPAQPVSPTEQRPPGTWRREPDMISGRAAHAVVATTDAIYAFAGTGGDGRPVLVVERFDGTRWNREAALPGEGINAPAAAVFGDTIYLIGGFGTTTNRPTTSVLRYNVRERRWSQAAPLPAPRGGHAATVLNGRIHVIGGGNSVSTIDDHTVYDPKTNTWSERARPPRSLGSPAGVVFDGKIYSIGGRSGPNDFGDVSIYDEAADAWTPGPPIEPRGTAGAAVLGGALYVFGGESQARKMVLDGVLRLDGTANAWTAPPAMPTARNYARAVVFKGAVYIVGGSTMYGAGHSSHGSSVVESFHPPAR
jgi:N-acetylneuraminic acid mutarotase